MFLVRNTPQMRLLLALSVVIAPGAFAAETVQPGFVLHDQGKANLTLSGISSGEFCGDTGGEPNVCNTGTKLIVQGHHTCFIHDNRPVPCMRYGYRYDYAGARPGSQIECTATRRDPFNKRQKTYTLELDAESGFVFQPESIPYTIVERRTMLTEVHECTYQGEPLATIEYIISYEPPPELRPFAPGDPTQPRTEEPRSLGLPNACNYLDPDLASIWIGGEPQRYEGAIEHIADLRSHCAYSHYRDATKRARIEHKYHLYELFDVEKLNPMQLAFHAAFAAGGHEPTAVWRDLGKVTFVFRLPPDRSQIMVVTDIQGPPGGAGRPRLLLGHYHLRNEDRSHEERLDCLKVLAKKSLELWLSVPPDANNTVSLPQHPEPPIRTCVE